MRPSIAPAELQCLQMAVPVSDWFAAMISGATEADTDMLQPGSQLRPQRRLPFLLPRLVPLLLLVPLLPLPPPLPLLQCLLLLLRCLLQLPPPLPPPPARPLLQ